MKNIIFYTTPNSLGCQMTKPVLDNVASKTGFQIINIDTSTPQGRHIAHKAKIHELPTVIIQDDNQEIARLNGIITFKDFARILKLENIGSLPVPQINPKFFLLAALAGVAVLGVQQYKEKKRRKDEDFE